LETLMSTVSKVVGPAAPTRTIGRSQLDTPRPQKPRTLRLLLAEDNVINQRLISRILEKRGHVVSIAADGRIALDMYKTKTFDLILMDVQMPNVDGLEATRAIRTVEQAVGGHIPIVAVTAYAMKGDRERCLDAGMDFYVAKPVQPQELIDVIDSLTRSGESAGDGGESDEVERGIFDPQSALALVEGDQKLLYEAVDLFIEHSPVLMCDIVDAVMARDAKAIQISAHALKGTVSNFAASAAYEAALRVEMCGRNSDFSDVGEAVANLDAQILDLTCALAAYRQKAALSVASPDPRTVHDPEPVGE
jgi:CheY-like chemotaxis protein